MATLVVSSESGDATPIFVIASSAWAGEARRQSTSARSAATAANFVGEAGQIAVVRGAGERLDRVLFGVGGGGRPDPMLFRILAASVPTGDYRIANSLGSLDPDQVALAWALGAYRFGRYKSGSLRAAPRLAAPPGCDIDRVLASADACAMARDMINTPANDMGPQEVEGETRKVAAVHGASVSVTAGEALLRKGYPAIHAVGRAAAASRAARIVEMAWGEEAHPLVALIGKGVVFDSGGLDIKPSAAMRTMKKDMGGAAHVIALAWMIMAARLPVRLVVLLPIVENAIGGDAMRPGDVLATRSGLSIEVGNTDAEGRLILADALTRAAELSPVLTIDIATLTGAARVALGPQVTPFYTEDEALAGELASAAATVGDALWRMPLWEPYASALESEVADIKNDPDAWSQAGSITAALFLKRFAPPGVWAHFDIFAWNAHARTGFPQGAEIQAIRALFAVLEARFS
ncbi:MAG TPA: leucyl aminopeptidase family protein [Caulobacteraceae bacterium]